MNALYEAIAENYAKQARLNEELAASFKLIAEDPALAASLIKEAEDVAEVPAETKPAAPAKKAKAVSIEELRLALASKTKEGKTAEVKALFKQFGGDRLSDIDPKDYTALLEAAEEI